MSDKISVEQEFNDRFLTEKQVSSIMGWTIKTLRNRRSDSKDHPPYIDRGRRVVYPKRDFFEWYCAGIKTPKKLA